MAKKSSTQSNSRLPLILGGVALIAVIAIFALNRGGGAGNASTQPVELTGGAEEVQRAEGMAMGDENAPVLLYEFADYQCPACAQFTTFAHPLIEERLVDEGIVRFVRYDFPIVTGHPHAFLASRAARCAGDQDRYWDYHDVLYGRQPSWSASRTAPVDQFVDFAGELNMDTSAFRQCLESDAHADEVTRNLRLGEQLGVTGTPTLMINGELVRVRDYTDLEERVMAAAGRSATEDPAAEPTES